VEAPGTRLRSEALSARSDVLGRQRRRLGLRLESDVQEDVESARGRRVKLGLSCVGWRGQAYEGKRA
jgi:hypothetical protein